MSRKIIFIFILIALLISSCTKTEYCTKLGGNERLSLDEAKQIAKSSLCLREGNLKETYFCNEETGTWWIDIDVEKDGCSPGCVINVETKKAEVNWRCTGLPLSYN